jgi:hypothetical protein
MLANMHQFPKLNGRIKVGHYHAIPQARANLYQAIRKRLGLNRKQLADILRLKYEALRYRERTKRTYHPCEIVVLQELSGMTWEEFGKLLNDIA